MNTVTLENGVNFIGCISDKNSNILTFPQKICQQDKNCNVSDIRQNFTVRNFMFYSFYF